MPRQPAPPHYLRRNDTVWTPPAIILLDTETRTIPELAGDVLALRLWAARFLDRKPKTTARPVRFDGHGTTTAELVAWLSSMLIGHKTVWLFAHNLGFDLTTTRLPLALVDAGWQVNDAAIGGRAPWMRMAKGSKVLTMVDSGSWLPMQLKDVAEHLGMVKPPLPAEDDSPEAWLGRCRADVDILATAVTQLLDWWDEHELGRFNVSGPASGWNAFRHRYTLQRVMIDPDPGQVRTDRLAVHGGRRGVWRVGRLARRTLLELDITAAHPTVAARLPLPMRRSVPFSSLDPSDRRLNSDRWGVVAEVELETEVPRWPVRWHKATWYPVGRFRAHLAGPEIAEAARLGCLRAIGPGWVHQLGHVLMPWAQWVLSVQADTSGRHPPAARLVAKHWGRAVIGKFSARGFDKIEMGGSPILGWSVEEGWDHHAGAPGNFVDIGGRRWWVTSTDASDNAYPAVLAWVESHVRLRLSRVIDALPERCVIQCDTDGLIVTEDGLIDWETRQLQAGYNWPTRAEAVASAINRLNRLIEPLTIRVKRSYDRARVLGPQHVEIPGERRFSGLPKDAKPIGSDRYAGHTWPKLQWQLANGDPRGYVRPLLEATVQGPYANGWVTTAGRVIPVRTIVTDSGATEVLPWEWMPPRIRRQTLAPAQHTALRSLMP